MSQDTSGSSVQLQQPDKLRVAPAEEQINGQDRQGAFEAVPQKGNRPCLLAQGAERIGSPRIPASVFPDINSVFSSVNIRGLEQTKRITNQQTYNSYQHLSSYSFSLRSLMMNFREVPLNPKVSLILFSRYLV